MMNHRLLIVWLIGIAFSNSSYAACLTEAEVGTTTPDSRFVNNGDGTISDIGTGLMWMRCPPGQTGSNCSIGTPTKFSFDGALLDSGISEFASHSDWRMPNIKELSTIVEYQCKEPSVNESFFPNTLHDLPYASSTPMTGYANRFWVVWFSHGRTARASWPEIYARHVRSID